MSENLDKALNNLQAQIDKEAEEKRKAEEERQEQENKKRKMAERFPEAVKENQIDEVQDLIAQGYPRAGEYVGKIYEGDGFYLRREKMLKLDIKSIEMAQILIDDARKISTDSESLENFEKALIVASIERHPVDAAKWDKLAKDNNISYKFLTDNINVFEQLLEQGFDSQCFDFNYVADKYFHARDGYVIDYHGEHWIGPKPEIAAQAKEDLLKALEKGYQVDLSKKDSHGYRFAQQVLQERKEKQKTRENFEAFAEKYYQAKNGYFYEIQVGKVDYEQMWMNPNKELASEFKSKLKSVLEDGYQVDASNENSKSAWFMKELQEEQKTGKPYRRDDEYYIHLENGKAIGECKVPLDFYDEDRVFSIVSQFNIPKPRGFNGYRKGLVEGNFEEGCLTGKVTGTYNNIYSGDISFEAQYKEGQLHGVYKELDANGAVKVEKYYENGVDVTEKRKALKKIAERRIAKEEKLSTKKDKPVILKKASKLQKALIAKKLEKSKEK